METFPRHWPFLRGIHRTPVNSPLKGQWHGALMFSLICVWINGWLNNLEAGDLSRNRACYDVIVIVRSAIGTSLLITSAVIRDKDFAMSLRNDKAMASCTKLNEPYSANILKNIRDLHVLVEFQNGGLVLPPWEINCSEIHRRGRFQRLNTCFYLDPLQSLEYI